MSNIGHNNPPSSPFELATESVDLIYLEAKNWMDGEAIENQAQADAVSTILDQLRQVKKGVDEARITEKKPFDDAAKEVQERYKPLLTKCDTAASACKSTLTPWLEKLDAEKRAKEAAAKAEAERLAKEAQDAIEAARGGNDISALEQREAAIEAAKRAEADANRASKDKAHASGGGRAIGLRTRKFCRMTDRQEAARYFWKKNQDRFDALLLEMAEEERKSGKSDIPGFVIEEERTAA
jgi:hypothetical protein